MTRRSREGVYELRARAVDFAGNERSTDERDGRNARRARASAPHQDAPRSWPAEACTCPRLRTASAAIASCSSRSRGAGTGARSRCGAGSRAQAGIRSPAATSRCSSRRSCRRRRGGRSPPCAPAGAVASRSGRCAGRAARSASASTGATRSVGARADVRLGVRAVDDAPREPTAASSTARASPSAAGSAAGRFPPSGKLDRAAGLGPRRLAAPSRPRAPPRRTGRWSLPLPVLRDAWHGALPLPRTGPEGGGLPVRDGHVAHRFRQVRGL